jgi:hypothetical protein
MRITVRTFKVALFCQVMSLLMAVIMLSVFKASLYAFSFIALGLFYTGFLTGVERSED